LNKLVQTSAHGGFVFLLAQDFLVGEITIGYFCLCGWSFDGVRCLVGLALSYFRLCLQVRYQFTSGCTDLFTGFEFIPDKFLHWEQLTSAHQNSLISEFFFLVQKDLKLAVVHRINKRTEVHSGKLFGMDLDG